MMGVSDILARWGTNSMYKSEKEQQPAFEVFGKSCGRNPGPMAEPIILADRTNRAAVEAEYCEPFKSKRGHHAVSSRQALGSLIIQNQMKPGDCSLGKNISRNATRRYGLQACQAKCPFTHGVMPEFRKRIDKGLLVRVNEISLKVDRQTPAHAKENAA